jgi:hypothetical protein
LGTDVGEEEVEVMLSGLNRRTFREGVECHRVFEGRWVGGNEFGACIEEKFLIGRKGIISEPSMSEFVHLIAT